MAHVLRNLRDPNVAASDFGYDEELTRWLEESGRRRAVAMKDIETTTIGVSAPAPAVTTGSSSGEPVIVRRLILFGVLTLSVLQYVFADTELRIAQLPTLIVFAAQEK
jgi:hypothetical protein